MGVIPQGWWESMIHVLTGEPGVLLWRFLCYQNDGGALFTYADSYCLGLFGRGWIYANAAWRWCAFCWIALVITSKLKTVVDFFGKPFLFMYENVGKPCGQFLWSCLRRSSAKDEFGWEPLKTIHWRGPCLADPVDPKWIDSIRCSIH